MQSIRSATAPDPQQAARLGKLQIRSLDSAYLRPADSSCCGGASPRAVSSRHIRQKS